MPSINISYDRGVLQVEAVDIIRVEGLGNYTKIHFTSGHPVTVAKVLHWFEDHLPQELFARIHRGHLVNKMFVDKINDDGCTFLLTNGEMIGMSRRKKGMLLAG
ncbi:MAG: LytTR family DNA-binding domain-containing protein [Chitinophagaceae bacterium]